MVTDEKEVSVNKVSEQTYGSIGALRQLLCSEGNEAIILRISSKGYTISNGIDYCCVGLKSKVGTDYLIQAFGKEAIALYDEATRRIAQSRNIGSFDFIFLSKLITFFSLRHVDVRTS